MRKVVAAYSIQTIILSYASKEHFLSNSENKLMENKVKPQSLEPELL